MTDTAKTARENTVDFLQSQEQAGLVFDDHDVDRAVLVGCIMIGEWMDGSGMRWLSQLDSNGEGRSLPIWQVQGYLHNALHCFETETDE